MQALTNSNPHHIETHIALAQSCLDAEIWGVARAHLTKALEKHSDERVYRLLAQLERDGTKDQNAARHWMEKAATARQAPCWVCPHTGACFDSWHAINPADNSFNTLQWRVPTTAGISGASRNRLEANAEQAPFPFDNKPPSY
jgi:HemY protein